MKLEILKKLIALANNNPNEMDCRTQTTCLLSGYCQRKGVVI
jgi:hypothetical protein